ncbi:MAG: PAS domain-containing protein, partial [Porticoccaceae bacterium]|nr:PAS domain-containing protein [Porticoccaceae bacterium]
MTRAEIAESEILLLREIHNLAIGQVELPSEVAKTDELNRSIELFSRAICLTHDAIWDWNLKTDEVYCSPGLKKLLGYRDDELKNKVGTWLGLIHPEDKERILEQTRDFLAGNQDLLESELRMLHKSGKVIYVQTRTYLVDPNGDGIPTHITGTHIDVTEEKKKESFEKKNSEVLKMVAVGYPASDIYDAIAHMYEERHPGMRCSMLELDKDTLLHGGAPSLPQEYCDAVHGLKYGPEVGSCGTSTYTGKQVLVEDIESDPKWADLKAYALPHGLRS